MSEKHPIREAVDGCANILMSGGCMILLLPVLLFFLLMVFVLIF